MNIFNLFSFYALLSRPLTIQTFYFGQELTEHDVIIQKINHRSKTVKFKVLTSTDSRSVENVSEFKSVPRSSPYVTFNIPDDNFDLCIDDNGEGILMVEIAPGHYILISFLDEFVLGALTDSQYDEPEFDQDGDSEFEQEAA